MKPAYYYVQDGQGSVTALTDPTDNTAATYSYDPYGQLTSLTSVGNVGIDNPWRYVGAYQDGTGLYHMGERYYDPSVGRFTQPDPSGVNPIDPQKWNDYTYVGGDPINGSDPTGLYDCSVFDPFGCIGNALQDVYNALDAFGNALTDAIGCLGHVLGGMFIPLPPTAGGTLADMGTSLVGGSAISILTSSEEAGIAIPAGYGAVAVVGVIVGFVALVAGAAMLASQCN